MDRVAEPLAADGGHGHRPGGPVPAAGHRHRGRAARASSTRRRWPAPRSSRPSCWPGSPPTGETVVDEPVATRAHTEEMLAAGGADIEVEWVGARQGDPGPAQHPAVRGLHRARATRPRPPSGWSGRRSCPGSLVTVTDIDLSPERLGFLGRAPPDGGHHRGRRPRRRDGLGDRLHLRPARHGGRGGGDPLAGRGAHPGRGGGRGHSAPPGSATSASCG